MSNTRIFQSDILRGLNAHDARAQRALVSECLVPLQRYCVQRFGIMPVASPHCLYHAL